MFINAVEDGERSHTWAIQEGYDVDTRLRLPLWMSNLLEIRICQFSSESAKWEAKIAKRGAMGKGLTQSQTTSYESWKANSEPVFVFSKDQKKVIRNAKQVKPDCVALKLHLSTDSDELKVSSSDGKQFRMVLLRGPPRDEAAVPAALDGPVPAGMVPEPEIQHQNDEDDGEEQDVLAEEEQLHADHDLAALQDFGTVSDDEEKSDVEILADSDDDLPTLAAPSNVVRVKDFDSRPAWKELSAKGLVCLPRSVVGCWISCHKTSFQWQGAYPHVHKGLSCSWGGSTNMNEKQALLKVIKAIVQSHLATNPKDKAIWQVQLDKIQFAMVTGV